MPKLWRSLEERFLAKVAKADGCWMWTGATGHQGYGHLNMRGKYVSAHRLSWSLHVGPIPIGLCVLHKCDVRNCVNPDHLFLGTHKDNALDRNAKGRDGKGAARGEKSAAAKLTDRKVLLIRARAKDGARHSVLGKEFGVDQSVISVAVKRRTWRHLPEFHEAI